MKDKLATTALVVIATMALLIGFSEGMADTSCQSTDPEIAAWQDWLMNDFRPGHYGK